MSLSQLKPYFIPLLAAGSGGFTGAYLAIPFIHLPQVPVLDTRAFYTTSVKLDVAIRQLSELQQRYQAIVSAGENQKNDFSQLQQTWFARLENMESKLEKLSVANSPAVIVASVPASPVEHPVLPQTLRGQLDEQGVQDAIRDMHSEDFNTRQRALRVLVLVGAPEIKEEIGKIILNEEEDSALRRDLIQSMDWQGLGGQLSNIFENSKDSTVRFATITAVNTSRLDNTEKQNFENKLINNFTNESDDFIRIATLNYFSNYKSPYLHTLTDSLNEQNSSQQVRNHAQFLTTSITAAK